MNISGAWTSSKMVCVRSGTSVVLSFFTTLIETLRFEVVGGVVRGLSLNGTAFVPRTVHTAQHSSSSTYRIGQTCLFERLWPESVRMVLSLRSLPRERPAAETKREQKHIGWAMMQHFSLKSE
ncbi:unnamed protein product [Ectocarpus fasciculatus]